MATQRGRSSRKGRRQAASHCNRPVHPKPRVSEQHKGPRQQQQHVPSSGPGLPLCDPCAPAARGWRRQTGPRGWSPPAPTSKRTGGGQKNGWGHSWRERSTAWRGEGRERLVALSSGPQKLPCPARPGRPLPAGRSPRPCARGRRSPAGARRTAAPRPQGRCRGGAGGGGRRRAVSETPSTPGKPHQVHVRKCAQPVQWPWH